MEEPKDDKAVTTLIESEELVRQGRFDEALKLMDDNLVFSQSSKLEKRIDKLEKQIDTLVTVLTVRADAFYGLEKWEEALVRYEDCLLYTSPSPRDATLSRMPSSA